MRLIVVQKYQIKVKTKNWSCVTDRIANNKITKEREEKKHLLI